MIFPDGLNSQELDATIVKLTGNLILSVIGNGIQIKEGTNARMGVATLAAGTVTVANTSVTANTRVLLIHTGSAVGNLGHLYCATKTPATSFVITSNNVADTDVVLWLLIEPAA